MAKSLERRLTELEVRVARLEAPLSADTLYKWAQALPKDDPLSIQADQELEAWARLRGVQLDSQKPFDLADLWGDPDPPDEGEGKGQQT